MTTAFILLMYTEYESMTKIYLTKEQLRDWCNIHRLKPEEAAVVIGISRAMIYKYLNGTSWYRIDDSSRAYKMILSDGMLIAIESGKTYGKVFVDINVFEKDLSQLTTGQKVDIESSVYPDEIFQGKISTIGNMFDGATRTVKVRGGIDNNDGKL